MKRPSWFGFFVVMATLVVAGGARLVSQWQDTTVLRSELELARMEMRELDRLRAENERLSEKQIPAAELESLRADHMALPRLRAELAALKKDAVVSP